MTPPTHRRNMRLAALAALVLGIAGLAAGWLLLGPAAVAPGPLSSAHAPMAEDCSLCHATPMRSVKSILGTDAIGAMDAACVDCHRHGVGLDRIHLVAQHGDPGQRAEGTHCADCHVEHEGRADLQAVAERACVDCHAEAEDPVTAFAAGSHPDFGQTPRADPGTLTFDHALHTGEVLAQCSDCHTAPSDGGAHERGAYMAPPTFDGACASCHDLALELPAATPAGGEGEEAVPARRIDLPHASLVEAAATTGLPDGADRLRASDGPCLSCHQLGEDGRIAPAATPTRWLTSARFDHGAHRNIGWKAGDRAGDGECVVCHTGIRASAHASDVNLPGLDTCADCHDDRQRGRCATCHDFHQPSTDGQVRTDVDAETLAKGELETRFGTRRGTPYWPKAAFFTLPQTVWGRPDIEPRSPEFYDEVFARYGLFEADFDNDGLPMGLVETIEDVDGEPHIVMTCEFCHSSRLFDDIVLGQPNRFSSMDRIFADMAQVSDVIARDPLYEWNPRDNTVVNAADQLGLLGLVIHQDDLAIDTIAGAAVKVQVAGVLKPEFDALAFVKTPPWYLYGTKLHGTAGYYFDGGHPKDGNFSAFTYLAGFHELDGHAIRDALAAWADGGHAWLATLDAPAYPFPVDAAAAARGRRIYTAECADCHGHYRGEAATPETLVYPGRVIPAGEVGTDPKRANFPASFGVRMRKVLRDDYRLTGGYVATPLTAIWARAPYLHNGAVPTLRALLTPETRPRRWVLLADPRDRADYLQDDVGWRFEPLAEGVQTDHHRVHDPGVTDGLENVGHTYGEGLSEGEKDDLIAFLKTL